MENVKGSEHGSIFTFKMAFSECFQSVFTTSRAECYSAYKIKVLHSQY